MRELFKGIREWPFLLGITVGMLLWCNTLLVAAPAGATGVYQMPSLSAGSNTWVVDTAEILSRISEGAIAKKTKNLARETGWEVRLVAIHRLDYGETAQSFTDKLFEKWFPTPEAGENQIVLVLDNVTNNAAIRTGEGVKSLLTDEIAQSVVAETLQAPLRQGDKYNQAMLDATDRLVAVLSGKPDPGPPEITENIQVEGTFTSAEETKTGTATVVVVVLLILATAIPMATYYWYQR